MEVPDMPYDDGARTIFLYTKGKKGNPTKELRELLQYMEKSKQENATSGSLQKIHKMVECVKQEAEVSLAYMRIGKSEAELICRGKREGIIEGKRQERENGIKHFISLGYYCSLADDEIIKKLMEQFENL